MSHKSNDIETLRMVTAEIASTRSRHIHPCFEALTESFLEVCLASQCGSPEDVMDQLTSLIAIAWRMRTEYWVRAHDVMYVKAKSMPQED